MTVSSKAVKKEAHARSLSLKEILKPVLSQLSLVEETLKSVGQESDGILKDSSRYVLDGGGKRLRAALVLYAASIEGGSPLPAKTRQARARSELAVAAAVELIHSATLVHDDIIDRSVLRRLKPTVNVQFGEEVAVLLGDFLYAHAFELLAGVGDAGVVSYMAATTQKMCEGELDQLKHRYRADLALPEYLSFIEKKTATLIAASAYCGARLAGLPQGEQESLASFGLNVGIAYQIVDDVLDVVGSEARLGKTLRTDAGNGKMTLPLILLLEAANKDEKNRLLSCLQSLNPDWTLIQSLLNKYGTIEKTQQFADRYFDRAMRSLALFKAPVRKTLQDLSSFILHRDY